MEAKWIKPRRETTQVFMITFMNEKLPEFISIPGEASELKYMNTKIDQCYARSVGNMDKHRRDV